MEPTPQTEKEQRQREKEVFDFASWQHPAQRLAMQSDKLGTWGAESITCTFVEEFRAEKVMRGGEVFFDLSSCPSFTVVHYYCLACQVMFDEWAIKCPGCGTHIRRP